MSKVIPYWSEMTYDEEGNITDVGKPLTNIPTVDEVRNIWCFGLPLSKEDGQAMPDFDIKEQILEAVAEVERRLGVFLKPTVVVCNPEERGLEYGIDYEVEEHPYDYEARMYNQYGFLQLREKPVLSLDGYKLVLPNGQIIIDFMTRKEWVKLDKTNGQINIVPYAGDPTLFAMLGGSASGYPFATGRINSNLPHMIYADYTAGFHQWRLPKDINETIAKISAVNILGIAGDALLAGVASMSTSIDGLSESMATTASATSATYGAHIKQYQDDIASFFKAKDGGARAYYRGFTMTGM